ncbi:MAG: alpha-1,4-glucan--maltose-1-phosphate maltosyltransferase [Actinobacteria bacterium]|nr:alpha-1,4-glucan--maltose-1-phosphate maltosyltransferase [Actinomycetota bacterium]NBY15701.1 alpha-1,4-glucan--maltose-1-phosphate maltosyltransferase [Actinomycetota bacterium]
MASKHLDGAKHQLSQLPNLEFGRIPVLDVSPVVGGGARPVKAVLNERFLISARVFREGHDAVGAEAVLINPADQETARISMAQHGFEAEQKGAEVSLGELGLWHYRVEAFSDPIATWIHRATVKIPAGVDVEVEFQEGIILLNEVLSQCPNTDKPDIEDLIAVLQDGKKSLTERLAPLHDQNVLALLDRNVIRQFVSSYGPFPVYVERPRALFGNWYEFFPRSEGAVKKKDGSWQSGTFKTAGKRLAAVAAMGFNVLYLPPIHPIGYTNRKGPNNTLNPGPNDPGSPWAIGSKDGGHDAIHPDLGTERDFKKFVKEASELGIEIALDLALQASPDHPWVKSNRKWFTERADGSIAYAENPPKKYQDIYPINFDRDPEGIFAEVERVVRHWMSLGVRIFRVDNPHTKPVAFWERLIAKVNATDPDVIFLAEAFTNPSMMRALGEAGFQQSYTYFTWRSFKGEIIDYLTELSGSASAYFRPNFFVNTPDILPQNIQTGSYRSFDIRATLAATLSPTWGVYAGFELYEAEPTKPGAEEYLDSEKYEYRPRNWDDPGLPTLAPYLTQLNQIRAKSPALHYLRNLRFHNIDSDAMLAYSKREGDNIVLVIVNLDPHSAQESTVHLNMPELGKDWNDTFTVKDELTGQTMKWSEHNFVRLDPSIGCALILTVSANA